MSLLGLAPLRLHAAPAVTVVKSVGSNTPQVGDIFRYNLVVNVPSGGPATAVSLSDVIPAGLQFVAASPGGVYSAGTVTWPMGSLNCAAVEVTMSAFADSGGSWGVFGDVQNSDGTSASSTLTWSGSNCDQPRHLNWFYLNPLIGYSVNTVTSVKLYYQWHSTDGYPVTTYFQNTGDLTTGIIGPHTLTAGSGVGTDQIESWDITALGGGWNFNALQYLTVMVQQACGGTGPNGAHSAYLNRVWAVVNFQSCGSSAWVDVKATNTLVNGQVVNNTAQVAGSNFSTVGSNTQPVTIQAPTLGLTKTASPSLAAPGESIQYKLDYGVFSSGINLFDNFDSNYGVGPIPNWGNDSSNKYDWVNAGGNYRHAPGGYSTTWNTATPVFSDGVVSVDFQLPAAGGSASIAYLYQTGTGKFYKSKVYPDASSPSGYDVDVQTGPAWLQVCGNAHIPAAAWHTPPLWNNIKVAIKNYTFTIFINDVQVFYCADTTGWISTPGLAGIFNDGTAVNYDNYHIGSDMKGENVRVWDTLPACMSFVSSLPPPSAIVGNYLRWDLGLMDPGQSGSIVVKASSAACAAGIVPNSASQGADNSQTKSSSANVTFINPLVKSTSATTVSAGTTFTYNLVYTATGGGTNLSDAFGDGIWNTAWIPYATDGDSNIGTAYTEAAGTLTANHWGKDIMTMIGSTGVNGRAQVDINQQSGEFPGVVFGYQGGKFYSVNAHYGYAATGADALELHYFNGTVDTILQAFTGLTLPSAAVGGTFTLAATRQGNQFAVAVNGVSYGTLVDAANSLPGAGVQGIYSERSGTIFDNFSWTPDYKALVQIWDTLPAGLALVTATAGTSARPGIGDGYGRHRERRAPGGQMAAAAPGLGARAELDRANVGLGHGRGLRLYCQPGRGWAQRHRLVHLQQRGRHHDLRQPNLHAHGHTQFHAHGHANLDIHGQP